jgi:hypothetical protein
LEFGSPKRPKFVEAIMLNFIDDMDSKVYGIQRYLLKDVDNARWSPFHRAYDRFFYKTDLLMDQIQKERGGQEQKTSAPKKESRVRPNSIAASLDADTRAKLMSSISSNKEEKKLDAKKEEESLKLF